MAEYYPVYEGNAGLGIAEGGGAKLRNEDFATAQKAFDNSLAIGSNTINERLKLLGDTHKTIALLNQEFNTKMFAQKVADRDQMYKAFMDGNASVKDYLPKDAAALKKYRDAYDEAYQAWSKNINDRDAAKKFKEAQDDLNDVAARLATRYTAYNQQQQEIQKTAVSDDKDKMNDNLNSWVDATDENGKPALPKIYQKFSDYDPDAVEKSVATTTTKMPVDANGRPNPKGLYTQDIITPDAKQTFANVDGAFEQKGSLWKYYTYNFHYIDTLPLPDKAKRIDAVNDFLNNEWNPTHPDQQLTPITLNSAGQIEGSPEDFTKKWLLATTPVKRGTIAPNDFALKVKTEADKTAIDWDKNAIDWARIGIDKDKAKAQIKYWDSKTTGSAGVKSEALSFATNIYSQLQQLADKNGVITPDKLRQLTAEQLKYLGYYQQVTDKDNNTIKGLNPLSLSGTDDDKNAKYLIQLDNGKIKVMKDPKLDESTGRWYGNWDNTKTTTVSNIATNRVNEENQLAGGKEINGYIGIDNPNADSGAGETSTTTTSGYQAKMPDGSIITSQDGVTWYDKDGNEVK